MHIQAATGMHYLYIYSHLKSNVTYTTVLLGGK